MRTLEHLGAQQVLVLVQELVGGAVLLDGVLGGRPHHHCNAVDSISVVLVPALQQTNQYPLQ